MDRQMIRNEVLSALKGIAPELETELLRADRSLREEVDLDSMDWLRFIEALNRRLGIAIAESDYQHVDTLEKLISYLEQKSNPAPARI
ncbi:acyl carrier protein [Pseudomonas moorei]|uniref:Acyl carrier protein n=1 Tax=Pseudomonas moorei TaxID=395599 RepID=A0A1H1FNM6_9PSED|nr:acyl carrier protein [Pseudomonas moorei]KAB0509598.1 acyl carrier protein [Pseudomonas moorei]SDR02485.1 Acyl carrier protein [Pseudomonas moorei]